MVGLTVHTLSERSIAGCSLAITSKLVHVVGIIWAAIVGVVVGITGTMAMLRVLALCTMSLTSHSCWVGGVVSAVLGVAISALRLWKLTLSVSRVSRSRTESAASTLLRGTSFLLGLCNRLAVAAIVVLVLRTLFSREI